MKARTLWKSLETQRETVIRHLWAEVSAKLLGECSFLASANLVYILVLCHVCIDGWF